MKVSRWILATLVLMLGVSSAQADYVTYTESAIATGILGSSSFTNALVSITLTSAGPTISPCTGVPDCTAAGGPMSIGVAGVGTATLTDRGLGVVDNSGCGCVGMSDFTKGRPLLFTDSPSFTSYNITQSIGPVTGSPGFNPGFVLPPTQGNFSLSTVTGASTFRAISTLTQPGGTVTHPTTFTQQGLGQISATIGGFGSEASYEFAWYGGTFSATASVSGAQPTATYEYQISAPGNPGAVISNTALDGSNSFTADISSFLAPGDYTIALLANSPVDPSFTIDFAAPVNGTATVPEPPALVLLLPGLMLLFLLAVRRKGLSLNRSVLRSTDCRTEALSSRANW